MTRSSLRLGLAAAAAVLTLGLAPAIGSAAPDATPAAQADSRLPVGYHVISPEEAHTLIKQGGVQILDVRTPEEFASGHIADAVNIPYDAIRPGMRLMGASDVDKPLLIYCRTGRRAHAVGPMLAETYRYVYNFTGVTQWPYELVR